MLGRSDETDLLLRYIVAPHMNSVREFDRFSHRAERGSEKSEKKIEIETCSLINEKRKTDRRSCVLSAVAARRVGKHNIEKLARATLDRK